jgi:mRNA-degrading endonuclease toxin of MazEF toxin-antitoxin module
VADRSAGVTSRTPGRAPRRSVADEGLPLVEQTTVVDPERLGRSAGRLDARELRAVDEALMLVLDL